MSFHLSSEPHEIGDHVELKDWAFTGEILHGFHLIRVDINGIPIDYVVKVKGKDHYCKGCHQKQLKFGYMSTNNSLNAYCLHCNKKQSFGIQTRENYMKKQWRTL